MKRFFQLMMLIGVCVCLSCSNSSRFDEDAISYSHFALGIKEPYSITGVDTVAGKKYMYEVQNVYTKSLGFALIQYNERPDTETFNSFSYKFNNTVLPTDSPDPSVCTYTFTIELNYYERGRELYSQGFTLASRTFTNKGLKK